MKQTDPLYFTASPLKFILLFLCTSGYYGFYWFYRNWVLFKGRAGGRILPVWRTAFAPVWAYSMFRDIDLKAQEKGISRTLRPAVLGASYIILMFFMLLPEPFNLLAHFSFATLLVMNNRARAVCRADNPDFRENGRFGALNILAVIFGGLLLAASVSGVFYKGPSLAERYLASSPYGEMFSFSARIAEKQ